MITGEHVTPTMDELEAEPEHPGWVVVKVSGVEIYRERRITVVGTVDEQLAALVKDWWGI